MKVRLTEDVPKCRKLLLLYLNSPVLKVRYSLFPSKDSLPMVYESVMGFGPGDCSSLI
jgi:hypothetical protein